MNIQPTFHRHRRAVTLSILALALTAPTLGCSDGGPELARVKGKLTLDGKPLPNATLTFAPEGGSTSYGMTNAAGEYDLMFTDTKYGAQLGAHVVSIEVTKLSKGELEELKAQGMAVEQPSAELPKQYRKAGVLSARVERGANTIDFPLNSKTTR